MDGEAAGGALAGVAHIISDSEFNFVEQVVGRVLLTVTLFLVLPFLVGIAAILCFEVLVLCFGVCFVEIAVGRDNCEIDDECQTRLILGPLCLVLFPLGLILGLLWGPFLCYVDKGSMCLAFV